MFTFGSDICVGGPLYAGFAVAACMAMPSGRGRLVWRA